MVCTFSPWLHLENVDDVGALGGLAALGDLVALLPVHLAGVGEEEQVVVGGGGKHVHHAVLVPGGDTFAALAALGLGRVLAHRGTLDVARLGEGKDALLLLDEVLDVQVVLHEGDLGFPLVAVLIPNFGELVLENLAQQPLVGKELVVVGNALLQLLVLGLQLLPVQVREKLPQRLPRRLFSLKLQNISHHWIDGCDPSGRIQIDHPVERVIQKGF